MLPASAYALIKQIVDAVSEAEYDKALLLTTASRCSAVDLARVIYGYGRTFSSPPRLECDVVKMTSEPIPEQWSVRTALWSESEGGRSDLELDLTVIMVRGQPAVELNDLRVF